MADYKDIKGGTVQNFAGDPPAPINGQLWYDSTAIAFQYYSSNPTGAWAAGNNINTARRQAAAAGIQTSALIFGGYSDAKQDITESYNGSTWTEVADLNVAKSLLSSAGATNTAALSFGGVIPPNAAGATTELWNGTSWTEVNDLNTARRSTPGAGTSTAALHIGGGPPAADEVELYNGTSWAEQSDLNTGRWVNATAGISTSALNFGGEPGSGYTAATESYNGSTWTEVADLITDRSGLGGCGANNTAALAFGGSDGSTLGVHEKWNGTSWAEVADLNTARNSVQGAGTTAAGLAASGYVTAASASTEEWNEPVTATETITD